MTVIIDGSLGVDTVQKAALVDKLPAGSVVQVVTGLCTSSTTLTGSTWTSLSFSASITPKSANSKILVIGQMQIQFGSTAQPEITLYRNGSNALSAYADGFTSLYSASGGYGEMYIPFSHLDSPASTSSQTYAIYGRQVNGSNPAYFGSSSRYATITLLEIAG